MRTRPARNEWERGALWTNGVGDRPIASNLREGAYMSLLLIIVLLLVLFGGGGGYYGYNRYGTAGLGGVLGTVLIIILVLWLVGPLGGAGPIVR